MKKLFPKLKGTSLFYVGTLVSSNIAAQIISLLFYPIITRLYSPEDFGFFGTYISIVILLGSIFTLQFNVGIPIPDDEHEAQHLRFLSIVSTFGFTTLSFILIFFFQDELASNYPNNYLFLAPYVYIIPFYLLFLGINQTYKFWFIRGINFVPEAYYKIITRTLANTAKLTPLFMPFKKLSFVLAASEAMAQIVSTFFFHIYFKKELANKTPFKLKGILKTLKKHADLPSAQTLNALLNTSLDYFPIFVFSTIAGAKEIGFLLLTTKNCYTTLRDNSRVNL